MYNTLVQLILFVGLIHTAYVSFGQKTNYDEAKIPAYILPDPLQVKNGKRITTIKEWNAQRPAIYKLFEQNVYGKFPRNEIKISYKIRTIHSNALAGLAIQKQIRIYFSKRDTTASMDMLLYIPENSTGPVPVFLGYNFCGNQCTSYDTTIKITERWMAKEDWIENGKGVENNRSNEESRGVHESLWPFKDIVSRGYGVATIYYGDVEPDHPEGWKTGIRTQLQKELGLKPEEWSAMGAWAWGLDRATDYLQQEPSVNPDQIILIGYSRLGKAALWSAAGNPRYGMVISNESGEGGAALSKRFYGETIADINTTFPHWYGANYKKFNTNTAALPVDQHMLLALIATRPLYVASAEDDQWSDPKGEFLSVKNAEPVYKLYNKEGLGVDEMPPLNHPVGNFIRYHIRTGKHDITIYDWQQYLKFADEQLIRNKQ